MICDELQFGADRVAPEKPDILIGLPHNISGAMTGDSDMKRIDISTPKHPDTYALVDDEDYDELAVHKWTAHEKHGTIYAERRVVVAGKQRILHMHRVIMNTGAGIIYDHIHGNGVDNRKKHLRRCSHKENLRNQKINITNKSGMKGVSWKKNQGKFVAQITVDGKNFNLGCHICPMRSAAIYNKAAAKSFGRFARLNQIEPRCVNLIAAAMSKEQSCENSS